MGGDSTFNVSKKVTNISHKHTNSTSRLQPWRKLPKTTMRSLLIRCSDLRKESYRTDPNRDMDDKKKRSYRKSALWASPEWLQKKSQQVKDQWANPAIRTRRVRGLKQSWTLERRAKQAEVGRRVGTDVEAIAKRVAAIKKRLADPGKRQQMRETSLQLWSKPAFKSKTQRGQRRAGKRPEVRQQRSESMIAVWQRRKSRLAEAERVLARRTLDGMSGAASDLRMPTSRGRKRKDTAAARIHELLAQGMELKIIAKIMTEETGQEHTSEGCRKLHTRWLKRTGQNEAR